MSLATRRVSRRAMLWSAAGAAAVSCADARPMVAQQGAGVSRDGLRPQKITAVELVELHGHYEAEAGVNGQSQVNPLDIYDDLRKPVYRDKPGGGTRRVNTSAIYLRIKTVDGLEGLYGPIEKEPAMVVWENLRPFLMGKDALATELLWDEMYRSNRHSRDGFFLMAISAVDNTLWI